MNDLVTGAHRSLRRVAVVGAVAYGAGALIRYGLIEREDLGLLCESLSPPGWCMARLLVIRAFLLDLFGLTSLGLLAVAGWRRSGALALAAIAIGTVGMVLYGFTWSGVGVLGGLLLAGRLQADRDEHRETETQH
jgi:hypothetical protein